VEALFDIRGTDMDPASYVDCSVAAVLASTEEVKKQKNLSFAKLHHASFTPFDIFVDEVLGHEALMFL